MWKIYSGKIQWGLLFWVVKSSTMDYYRLSAKTPTAESTLDKFCQLIDEYGRLQNIIMHSHSVLGFGEL